MEVEVEEENPEELPIENDSRDCGLTIWHFLILIGISSGTILEGLMPHSFGTFIANFRSEANSSSNNYLADVSFIKASQFQLNWLPALTSALPCILLPLFSLIIRRIQRFYQLLSITSFLLVAISCLFSSLVNLWGILFVTYSLIYSIGTSIFLAVVIVIVSDYFPLNHKCHVLATSLYQIGYPTAALIGNPMLASLIVRYGWRNSLKYVALMQILIGLFVGFIMKPEGQGLFCEKKVPEEEALVSEHKHVISESIITRRILLKILKTPQFWPWLIGKYINYLCWYGLRTNIVTYLVSTTSFGLERSARLMSVYAIAEVIVALIASLFGDRIRGWLIHIHIVAAAMMAILTGIYPVTLSSYVSAIFLMLFIGIAVQCSLSFGYPASVEVLNAEFKMESGWIITNVAAGLGILSSPIISGLLMDRYSLMTLFYAQCLGWTLQAALYAVTLFIIEGCCSSLFKRHV